MLEAMRQLGLDALWVQLDGATSADPEAWYLDVRAHDLGRLAGVLVEPVERKSSSEGDRYYTLRADPQDGELAVLEVHEMKAGDAAKLPFLNRPPIAPAVGPIVKRTNKGKGEFGPTAGTVQRTLTSFAEIALSDDPAAPYFAGARDCFARARVRFNGTTHEAPAGALNRGLALVEEKGTVLVAYRDKGGRLPGEIPEFLTYLAGFLAEDKYVTKDAPGIPGATCALCGRAKTTVYAAALDKAGIHLSSGDRAGAFPGVDASAAWKGFAICVACADLLYVYWYHVAKDYRTSVAGEKALVIPSLQLDPGARRRFAKRLREWVTTLTQSKDAVTVREKQLLGILGDDRAVASLTVLWAEFGQRIDDIRGIITDILPSRLQQLAGYNRAIERLESPVFPEWPLEEFEYNLPLTILKPLLRRPGGKAAQNSNESRRLFDLRRDLAEAIYHASPLPPRFFDEVHETARWHFAAACESGSAWPLLHEGRTKDGKTFLTAAGWVRQVARFLHYLRSIGVMPMPDTALLYQPTCEALKPYFGQETAIDSRAKAFAFILGALYGKLLQIQAARGVNVVSNALTWLKRLTLAGKDLPELYNKVREKTMLYGAEGNETVRQLVQELGELGTQLGTAIELDDTQTCYFLLLGQSLATKIMPSKQETPGEGEQHG